MFSVLIYTKFILIISVCNFQIILFWLTLQCNVISRSQRELDLLFYSWRTHPRGCKCPTLLPLFRHNVWILHYSCPDCLRTTNYCSVKNTIIWIYAFSDSCITTEHLLCGLVYTSNNEVLDKQMAQRCMSYVKSKTCHSVNQFNHIKPIMSFYV